MCRWLAYRGIPIRLASLLTQPDHSLIDQSLHARQNVSTTNGDGFGVGWYAQHDQGPVPALYRDIQPAWNDDNLRELAAQIDSPMFLAHVRSATGTAIQRTNCHPFRCGEWLFQHNGSVPDFHQIKRQMILAVAPQLFSSIQGSTDSELLFYLALTFGLKDNAVHALARAVGFTEHLLSEQGVIGDLHFTAAACDGHQLIAVRYSRGGTPRTLYHSGHSKALSIVHPSYPELPDGATVIVSEPLGGLPEMWEAVPESTSIVVSDSGVEMQAFAAAD